MDLRDRHDTSELSPGAQAFCIRLFGEFSVSCNGQYADASSWRFSNAKRLVQILALTPGHRIHREQLTDWFWPATESRLANNSLHQVLHHARRALTSIGLDRRVLRLERNVLSLQAPAGTLWIDVEAFEAAAHNAQQHKDPAWYRAAFDLYSGELLPEERYADWAASRRDALHMTYLGLLLQLGEIYEARGGLADAERMYSRLIVDDPANESGHAGLMRVYALTGRRHQSFAQYRQLEAVTRRELDVDPSPEILELRDKIGQGIYPYEETIVDVRSILAAGEAAFVGRERELQMLREAVEQSFSGRGRVLMLSGEPGVGKTRTAREVTAYARRGGSTVLWGNCYQGDGAPAYWPWVQIIREAVGAVDSETLRHVLGRGAADIGQIVPEVGERLPEMMTPRNLGAEQARFQLFDSITRFFKQLSLRSPLFIVLDDLHWSDRSTLLLLSFLAREVDHSRMVILGTYRDTEIDRDHPLLPTLAELSRSPALQRLSLSRLSESDVRQLIETFSDRTFPDAAATLIFQRTEGNPYFVGEVLRLMREEGADRSMVLRDWATTVPQGVSDVISHRLSRQSTLCAEVLAGAGVSGREFSLSILELTVARGRRLILDALDEALHAQLIEEVAGYEGRYRFTHALVQETVYNVLASARKAELHRRTAEALERLHTGEIDRHLTELAYHYARAAAGGQIGLAVSYGIRAGDQALERIAYSEAMDHYQRTLDVIESFEPSAGTDLLEVLLKLGDAHNHVGNRADARTTFRRAADVSRELRLPTQFAGATLGYAGLGIFNIGADHIALLEEAVAWLPEEDSVVRARILARLAFELNDIASIDRRSALIHEAEGIARRIGDPSTLIFVLITKSWAIETLDNLDARLALSGEVLTLVEESDEILLAPTAHAMRFYDGLEAGDIELCERQIAVFDVLADRHREPQRKWLALVFKAECAVIEGRYSEAEEWIESAREIARNVMPTINHDRRATSLLVAIRREQGRLGEVESTLEAVADSYAGNLYWPAMRSYVRSELSHGNRAEHDIEDLLAAIERVDRLDGDTLAAAALLSMTDNVTGNSALAGRLYEIVRLYCGHYIFAWNTHHWHGPVGYYAGRLANAIGLRGVAEQHFSQAIAMSERMKARPFLAHSQYELASLLHLRDELEDSDRSAQLLSRAYDAAIEIGMPVLAENIHVTPGYLASSR